MTWRDRWVALVALGLTATAGDVGTPLDRGAFLQQLDLTRPELAEVRDAVGRGDLNGALALWRDQVVRRLRERDFGHFGWHGYKGHPRPVTRAKYYCGTATEEELRKWQPALLGTDGRAARVAAGNFEEPFPSLVFLYWQSGDPNVPRRAFELMSDFCATNQPHYWQRYRAGLDGVPVKDDPPLDDWRLNLNALTCGWRWKNVMQVMAGMAKCLGPDKPREWDGILGPRTGPVSRDGLALVPPDMLATIALSGYEHHAGRLLWFCLRPGAVPNQRSTGLKALAMLNLVFPGFRKAPQLAELLDRAYSEMLESNFLPDGGSLEQSFNYNSEDMRGLEEIAALYTGAGPPFVRTMLERAAARRAVDDKLRTPLGGLPQVGNSHAVPGQDVWSSASAARRYLESAGADAVGPQPFLSAACPYSGFYAMRSGWELTDLYLFLMNGRPQRGHSMRDSLSVQVTAYGRQMVVCGGPPTYGNPRNDDAKGAAHYLSEASSLKCNTVLVDGKSQAKHGPQLSVAPQTPVRSRWHTSSAFDLVDGRYALGYETPDKDDRRLDVSVKHERTVVFVRAARLWLIADRLIRTAPGDHSYTQVWNFMPHVRDADGRVQVAGFTDDQFLLAPAARQFSTADPDGPNVEFIQFGPSEVEYRKYFGDRERWLGWYARGIGDAVPAADVHVTWSSRDSDTLLTLLVPRDVGCPSPVVASRSTGDPAEALSGFECELRGGARLDVLASKQPRELVAAGFTGRAEMLLVWRRGGITGGIVRGGRELLSPHGARLVSDSDSFEFSIGADGEPRVLPIRLPLVPEILPAPQAVLSMSDHPPVTLGGADAELVIRYTTDGREPDEGSALYRGPIRLTGETTVKARFFRRGQPLPLTAARHYRPWRWSLREPDRTDAAGLEPGLHYAYAKRDRWSRLYDLMKQAEHRPLEAGRCDSLGVRPADKLTKGQSALVFEGYLRVPRDGLYTFHVTCRDGMFLFIRNPQRDLELPAAALCSYRDGEGQGSAALRAGYHQIRLAYKESPGSSGPEVRVAGAGTALQRLPAEWLYREAR